MRYVNLVFGAIVFVCAIYVSFNHSIYLFHIGGYLGYLAIAGVIAGETLYAMGIVNTVHSLMSKTPAPISARIATIIGTLMVGWANIYAGWGIWKADGNATGIILGVAIMSYLWVADWIIVETLTQFFKKSNTTTINTERIETPPVTIAPPTTTDINTTTIEAVENDTTTKVEVEEAVERYGEAGGGTTNTDNATDYIQRKTKTLVNINMESAVEDTTNNEHAEANIAEETTGGAVDRTDTNPETTNATANTTTNASDSVETSTSETDCTDKTTENNTTKSVEFTKQSTKVVDMAERRKKDLDDDTIIAIFLAEGSNAEIGRQYGVSAETVRRIKLGKRHAHITAPYRNRQAN